MVESKRSGIFFVGVLMLSVSCETSKDVDQIENLNKIEFQCSSSEEAISRGIETDNTTINNFGVYAYYTEADYNETNSVPNFMFNSKVSRTTSTDAWTYAPVMYWPTVGGVSFFAYSPYAVEGDPNIALSSTLASVGAPKLTYTVPNNVVDHIDLLISTPLYNQTKTLVNNVANKLSIPFKHALSSIVFKAKVQAALTGSVKVKSINIGKLKSKAKVDYTTHLWDMSSDAVDMDYPVAIGSGLEDTDISKTTAYTNISTTNGRLMVLPQVVDPTDVIIVVVEMTIKGKLVTRSSEVNLSANIPTLAGGNRYTINIKVLALADVDLTININPWLNEEVNVPDFN